MIFISFLIFSILISLISSHSGVQRNSESSNSHENRVLKRSYESSSGNNILISNFGEKEFECFGSCYCDEEKRKTSFSFLISKRTSSYFLVSLSSILAFKKAKTYFDSKCQNELSEECHLSSIKSSVEKCSPVNKKKELITDEEYFEKRENEERRVYFCYGNCLYRNHKLESTIQQFKQLKCEKLKKEGEIIVHESDLIVTSKSRTDSQNYRSTALTKFVEYYLTDYCKENSQMEYIWEGEFSPKVGGKKYFKRQKFKGYGCVGTNRKGKLASNVRCRQIDPEPTNYNWKWNLEEFNREKEEWDLL